LILNADARSKAIAPMIIKNKPANFGAFIPLLSLDHRQ
jgi:hypothetical protein